MQLEGKVAIVTGGGRGIGKAIALAFAREGAKICICARSSDEIDTVASEITDFGGSSIAIPCDVSDHLAVWSMVEAAMKSFGAIDILVNNAGGAEERKKVGFDDIDTWSHVIMANLMGVYYCSRAVLPYMKESGGGSIINIGSSMGHQPTPGNTSYNTAKAASWMFTRCLSLESWSDNIHVNELIPGPVLTNLTSNTFTLGKPSPTSPSEIVKAPEDVVPLALFLATMPEGGPTGQSFSLSRKPYGG